MAPPPGGDPEDPPPIPPRSPVPPENRPTPVPRNSRTSRSTSPTVVPESAVAKRDDIGPLDEDILSVDSNPVIGSATPPTLPPVNKPTAAGIKERLDQIQGRRQQTAKAIGAQAERVYEQIMARNALASVPPHGTDEAPPSDPSSITDLFSRLPPAADSAPAAERPKFEFEPMSKSLSRAAGELLQLLKLVFEALELGTEAVVVRLFEPKAPAPQPAVSQEDLAELVETLVEEKLRERISQLIQPPIQFDDWAVVDASSEAEVNPPRQVSTPKAPEEALARRHKFTAATILVAAVVIPVIFWVIVWQFGGITELWHDINTSTDESTPQPAAGVRP